MTSQQCDG